MTFPYQKTIEVLWLLRQIATEHAPAALASSLGAEDMVLTDVIATDSLPISIFMLDTERLPRVTYELLERVRARYAIPIEVHHPEASAVDAYVAHNGKNAFYESVALRKECCDIRKAAPLARALRGKGAWITGLRRSQAATRTSIAIQETDAVHGLTKFNPLADWTEEDVWGYIRSRDVPYNALHDRNYPSIGCDPCTRAVKPGEDIRAGRWWWEHSNQKECGLHPISLNIPVAQADRSRS
jgi:phosphoadenosine phosphosulfate reductase